MINFDQASSSFPKAPPVAQSVADFITTGSGNINRGSLNISYEASKLVFKFREYLVEYFDAQGKQVVLMKNITESLNILIQGFFEDGDHVIISSLEHNALMRPLHAMTKKGVSYSIIPCENNGVTNAASILPLIKENTKAILVTAASNVVGTIMPLKDIGKIARKHNLRFFVDSAQLAGFSDISVKECNIDALAITGHKSLLGPQGIGALILDEKIGKGISPLIYGGTGSISDQFEMPDLLPERFEAGTINLPGVAGLASSIAWLRSNHRKVVDHELKLCRQFMEGAEKLPVRIIGLGPNEMTDREYNIRRTPVVSLDTGEVDPAILAYYLESEGGIATRVGLHCSPLTHKALGTFPGGTIRFSFGYAQTEEDVQYCLSLMNKFFEENYGK